MVTGVPGECSESAQKLVEAVRGTETENVTTLHRPMVEKIVKGHPTRLSTVTHIHALVRQSFVDLRIEIHFCFLHPSLRYLLLSFLRFMRYLRECL